MAGTPSNYAKILEEWFTTEFIPACAAYAVFYDFSDWEKLYTKKKGPGWEKALKIKDGALTKKGTYEEYKKVQKAAAEVGMKRSSGEGAQLISTAVSEAESLASQIAEMPDSDVQASYDQKIAALGDNPDPMAIEEAEAAKGVEKFTHQAKTFYRELQNDPRMLGPVLDAILKLQDDGGWEGLLWAIWSMTRKYKFSYGAGNWARGASIAEDAAVQFNILISTIIRNPEDPKLHFLDADSGGQYRKGRYGIDASGKTSSEIMDIFGPLFKVKDDKWVPLCYTEPWFGQPIEASAMETITEAGDLRPGNKPNLAATPDPAVYFLRYLLATTSGHGKIDLPIAVVGTAPTPSPWSGVAALFTEMPSNRISGVSGRPGQSDHSRGGDRYGAHWTGAWTPEYAANTGWALQAGAIFYYFQQIVVDIGKATKVKSGRRPWYHATVEEILGGAAPKKRRRRRSRVRKPKPNKGKRKLAKGEVRVTDLQCVLLENIKQLAAARDAVEYKTVGKIGGVMPGNVVSKLHHGTEGVGKKSDWPPTAGGPDGEAYALQNMCPDIWALMTPHIELFRVSYSGSVGGQPIPRSEHQIPFSNFIDQENIDEITAGAYGRQGGAGIKSFSWSLDGVQPAEVDNMITANLVMHFQSVYDLFRHNEIPGQPGQFGAGINGQPGYLDLIIGSGIQGRPKNPPAPEQEPARTPHPCESLESQKYDSQAFEIKAIVGWATPPGFTDMEIPGYSGGLFGDLANIQQAIEGSRRALYLTLTSHQINFQQDGTLELSVNYQARLSGLLRSTHADIFTGKELYEEEIKALNARAAEATAEAAGGTSARADTQLHKEAEEAHKKVAELMRRSRVEKYTVFLSTLQKKNKMRGMVIPTKELLQPLAKMTPEERLLQAKIRQGRSIVPASPAATAAAAAAAQEGVEAALESIPEESDQEKVLTDMNNTLGIFNTKKSTTTTIPFFYLGDLIDVVMGERLNHLTEKDGSGVSPLQMMLAPVELIDPLQAFQIETVTFQCPNADPKNQLTRLELAQIDPLRFRSIAGISTTMNIGSIPISLEAFNSWFMNTVVRREMSSYFLLNFIKDVCSGLVSDAYSSHCFKGAFQYNIKFDTAIFRMADNFQGKTKTIHELGRSARAAATNDLHPLSDDPYAPLPSTPTVVLYSVDSRPTVGDRASDMSDGIYHYFLGGRCGLTKEITFTRQDMPFYREARIEKDGSLGAQQLKELYTVQMNMIGNTLHKNGTYVYIDPIAIGAGSSRAVGGVKNIARLIGLGGYFLVSGVQNEFTPSGYSTTVNALQEMSAFDEGMDEKIVEINGAAVDSSDPANSDNLNAEQTETSAGNGDASANEAGDITGDASGTVTAAAEGEDAAAAEGEEGATPDATTEEQAAAQLARSQEQALVAAAAVASAEDLLRAAVIAARDSRRDLIADLESRGMSTESLGQTDEERAVADLADTLQELIRRRDQLNRRIDRATS